MPELNPLQIRLPEDLQAKFVNMVRISHTPGEFILDCLALLPGAEGPKVETRLVFSPLGLKMMQQAINENVRRYEAAFGEIRLPQPGHTLADDLFKGSGNPNAPDGR